MAITYETSTLATTTANVNTLTSSFTVTSANLLVVSTSIRSATDANRPVTGITFNGVALTKVREDQVDAQDIGTGIWYLVNPSVGTFNVVTTCTGAINSKLTHMPMGLIGVDTASPVDTTGATANGTGTADVSVSVTTATNGAWCVDAVFCKDDTGITVSGAGHTQRQNTTDGGTIDVSALGTLEKATAGAQTLVWTAVASGEAWLTSGVAFKPSGGAPPTPINFITYRPPWRS